MKVSGSLLGLAIGDALGAPLEGYPSPGRLVEYFEEGGMHGVRKGQITDDTLQAMAIAESLVICRGYSPEDLFTRFIRKYRANPKFFGPTSSAVFDLVMRGISPLQAARIVHLRKGWSRSNGSVMRGAPLGIAYPPPLVHELSVACSRLTHFDPVAAECSAFINRMISEMVRGSTRQEAFDRALSSCRSSEVLRKMQGRYDSPLIPSLDALEATHCAVSLFLDTGSFRDCVIRGVNLGGDSDTIGALCGALAGGFWGLGAIPSEWILELEDVHEILALSYQLTAILQE
jgi:ADP-ribosyl-[dinitrogen reductase] hydrolase